MSILTDAAAMSENEFSLAYGSPISHGGFLKLKALAALAGAMGNVTAAAVLDADFIVRGAGASGIKTSGWQLNDDGGMAWSDGVLGNISLVPFQMASTISDTTLITALALGDTGIGVKGVANSGNSIGVIGEAQASGDVGLKGIGGIAGAIPLQLMNEGGFKQSQTFLGTVDRAVVWPDLAGTVALLANPATFTTLGVTGLLTLGTANSQIIGAAGNMTITAGTGNSRTLILQTTTAGGVATTALTLGADQSATFIGQVLAPNGTAALPGLSFSNDPDTGFHKEAGNRIAVCVGGGIAHYIDANSIQAAAGAVGTPSFRFAADTTKGMYHIGADILGFSCASTERLRLNTTGGTLTGAFLMTGVPTVCSGTATPAGGSTAARLLFGTTAGFGIYYGSGAPSALTAAQGSIYLRSDGSTTATRLYVNTNGGTTWTNFTSAA